jgi:chromosomal replication initiator protein
LEKLWSYFLSQLKQKTSPQTFDTWFKPLKLSSISAKHIEIVVPNQFSAGWLKENYIPLFKEVAFDVLNDQPEISFKVNIDKGLINKKEKGIYYVPQNINPKNTFSNFIVGSSNQFAHAASLAVANNIGGTYNPLFIYGGVGLGKTHLLNAIVHHCLSKNYNTKICYITSEKFTNELINSIRYEKMISFRNKYRNMDVLLLDDIQFIAGKERTQEEFFNTFNALFEIKKQIVVTSDKSPREIAGLEERLRSRFEWGLIADIQPPDTETKVAILEKKAVLYNMDLSKDVAFFIASNIKSNDIRELEGILTKLQAYASLSGYKITVGFAEDVLKDLLVENKKVARPDDILKAVCNFFNLKTAELKAKRKNTSIVLPRQIAMYILRKKTKLSYPEIGFLFGGKDHSTVIYATKKIDALMKNDLKTKQMVDNILKSL